MFETFTSTLDDQPDKDQQERLKEGIELEQFDEAWKQCNVELRKIQQHENADMRSSITYSVMDSFMPPTIVGLRQYLSKKGLNLVQFCAWVVKYNNDEEASTIIEKLTPQDEFVPEEIKKELEDIFDSVKKSS